MSTLTKNESFISTKEEAIIHLAIPLSTPCSSIPFEKIGDLLIEYRALISSFMDSIGIIKDHLKEDYLFLLTDKTGILIAKHGNLRFRSNVLELKIGASFTEKSCGANAISLAMKLKKSIVLLPAQHRQESSNFFFCYSVPLHINSETICYLMVYSTRNVVISETIAITQLIKDRIITHYHINGGKKVILTEKQQYILTLLSQGMTTQAIALHLAISPNTVKYYKKKIFETLDVQSTSEAITKAIRHRIIEP